MCCKKNTHYVDKSYGCLTCSSNSELINCTLCYISYGVVLCSECVEPNLLNNITGLCYYPSTETNDTLDTTTTTTNTTNSTSTEGFDSSGNENTLYKFEYAAYKENPYG